MREPREETAARPPDAVMDLVRGAAMAWRDRLAHEAPLAGFLVALQAPDGPRVILAEGACSGPSAERMLAAFAGDCRPWRGPAEELARRLGEDPLCAPGATCVVFPLEALGRVCGLIVAVCPSPVPDAVVDGWMQLLPAARCVAALFAQHEAERTEAEALRALDAISQVLSRPTRLRVLYNAIHREVSRVMECDAFYVCLLEPDDSVHYVYMRDQGVALSPHRERLAAGPTVYCLRTGLPFLLSEENASAHRAGTMFGTPLPSQSAIHVPMMVDGQAIGVLSAQAYRPGAFDERHVRLLVIIAAKAAVAVRNTQLLERLQAHADRLEKLTQALQVRDLSLRVVDDLVLTTDVDGIVTTVNEAVTRTLGYEPDELIGRPVISIRVSGRGNWRGFRRARGRRITVQAKDGRVVPVLYGTEPLKVDGKVVGWLTVARNLSDMEEHEEQHREAMALERQRIARDLHDGLIQSLSIAKMQLQILQREPLAEGAREAMAELQETLTRGLAEARQYMVDLRHAQLDHHGLVQAARAYAHELGRATGLAIGVTAESDSSPLGDTEEVQMFYILREALNNVRKHAGARRVRVEFRHMPEGFRMTVEDDGRGFDPSAVPPQGHWGLAHIRERAEALGGHATVESAPGKGARVCVDVPLPDHEEDA